MFFIQYGLFKVLGLLSALAGLVGLSDAYGSQAKRNVYVKYAISIAIGLTVYLLYPTF